MTIDWARTLYDPAYAAIGVPATLDLGSLGSFDLTVLDKTSGVEISQGQLGIYTQKPAAVVRVGELDDNSITLADLDRAPITFNGNTWKIAAHEVRSSPDGAAEVYLILRD